MGSVNFRTYFDVTGEDRSRLGAQVEGQRARVRERLASVRATVAVMSGKGGVGKSYVTASLAAGLSTRGRAIGVLDADLRSPTVARLLDASGPLRVVEHGVEPATGLDGVRVVSSEFLLDDGQPLAWRGPDAERHLWRGALEAGMLREFLGHVVWGTLDVLLIDLPPGADAATELAPLVPDMAGTIAVTVPSEESRRSVERAMRAAYDAGLPLLGVVENMSGYACAKCGQTRPLFAGDAGARLADEFRVPLLARIPFDPGGLVPSPAEQVGQLLTHLEAALS